MATMRERCQRWSDEHSHSEVSEFNPEWHEDYNLTQKEYIKAYYEAFVKVYKPGEGKDWKKAFKHWLVDVVEEYTEQEFNEEYFEVYA